jgi:hypothetical protein
MTEKFELSKKTEKEILNNWFNRNCYLGIKRFVLESLSKEKKWRVRKVIAKMRREKLIFLDKRNYFINTNKLAGKELIEDKK